MSKPSRTPRTSDAELKAFRKRFAAKFDTPEFRAKLADIQAGAKFVTDFADAPDVESALYMLAGEVGIPPDNYSAREILLMAAGKRKARAREQTEQGESTVEQHVTLNQMAAIVNRSKRTLEKKNLPDPDIEGGGGKPHEWLWHRIRPWLEAQFSKKLPIRFPGGS